MHNLFVALINYLYWDQPSLLDFMHNICLVDFIMSQRLHFCMFNFCTSNLHQVPLTPSLLGFLNSNMKQLLTFGYFFSLVTYNIYHCPLFNIVLKIHPMGCVGLFTHLLTSFVFPMFHSKMVISHWPNNCHIANWQFSLHDLW
jgi:hypothetical protein